MPDFLNVSGTSSTGFLLDFIDALESPEYAIVRNAMIDYHRKVVQDLAKQNRNRALANATLKALEAMPATKLKTEVHKGD